VSGDLDTDGITLHVPTELPVLTTRVSRILLGILVELTKVEILDEHSRKDTE